MMKLCRVCAKELKIETPVGRQERCPFCGADLHCCRNCAFYSKSAYNECHEPQAERVLVKDRSNFCDFFLFCDAAAGGSEKGVKDAAKVKLDALFSKG
jgi:hypothetical protein